MEVAYIKRHETIRAALDRLENYPAGSKRPSLNSIAKEFGLAESTLRRAFKSDGHLNRPPGFVIEFIISC